MEEPCSKYIIRTNIFHLYKRVDKINRYYSHLSFSSLLFSLFSLFFLIGLKWARTLMNWRKLTRSSWLSAKNEWTIRSLKGLIASSGIRRKSSLERVPQSFLSSDVNLEYRRSIWFGVTVNQNHEYVISKGQNAIKFYAVYLRQLFSKCALQSPRDWQSFFGDPQEFLQ